jgi:hypothetical protein
MANEFIIKNGYFSQGSSNVTGSLTVTAGVTASLQGTASWSNNAITSSYIVTAQTASYVLNAVSSSFARTASFLNSTTNAFIQGGNSFGATALLGTNDTQNLNIETNGLVRMSISSSGQVVYGSNPLLILSGGLFEGVSPFMEIQTGTTQSAYNEAVILRHNSNSATAATRSLGLLIKLSSENMPNEAVKMGGMILRSTNTFSNSPDLHFVTANTERMTITAAGNVGIGTTAPNAKVRVDGNVIATSFTGSITGSLVGSLTGTASFATSASNAPNFANTDLTFTGNRVHDTNGNIYQITTDAGAFQQGFYYLSNAVNQVGFGSRYLQIDSNFFDFVYASTSRLRITSSLVEFNTNLQDVDFRVSSVNQSNMLYVDAGTDRIGIAKLPTATLDITGSTLISGSLVVSASGATNDFQVGANKLFVSASGNVGIGTTNPLTKLNIIGDTGLRVGRTSGGDTQYIDINHNIAGVGTPAITSFSPTTNAKTLIINATTDALSTPASAGNVGISLLTYGTGSLWIDSKQFVGVGISTPTAKLHVTNTSPSASFLVEDSTNPDSSPFVIDSTGKVVIGGLSPYSGVAEFTLTGSAGVVTFGQGVGTVETIAAISTISQSYSLVGSDNSTVTGGSSGIGLRTYGSSSTDTLFGYPVSSSVALLGFPGTNARQFMGTTSARTVVLGASKELIRLRGEASVPYVDITGSVSITGSLTVSGSSTFTNIGPANFTGSLGVSGSTNLIGGVNVHNKYYFINTLNDLPTPSAGVITLADNVTYFFTTTVDLAGNRLVCGKNTTILGGSSENCRIKSTGLTGTPLISSSYSIPMRGITIEADVALRLDASGSNEAIDWFGVNFTDCPTVGLIKNYNNVIMTDCAFLESANCTFDGTIGTVGFVTCLFNGRSGQTIMSVSPTGSITRRFRPIYSSFIALSGETALNVPTGSIANSEGYILDTCNFSGGGTYLSGSNTGSLKSLFVNNVGITNTTNAGHYYMINNTTDTTIGVSNVNVYVKAAGTTTIGTGNSPKWIRNGLNNQIVYSGSISQDFKFTASGTVQSSGTNQVISVAMARNGIVQPESEVTVRTATANQPYPFAVQDLTSIAFGDYVEVFVANTNSTNVRVGDLNVIIDKIGS